MPTGSDYSYGKVTKIHFTVKNVSPNKKTIKLFGIKVRYGGRVDLLSLPYVSESDIRDSLVKGELSRKIRTGDIQIVSSSIDLLQFDDSQRNFINSAYNGPGLTMPGTDPITQCGGGGSGGGTTLEYLKLTNDPAFVDYYDGPLVSFTKTNYGSEVDFIDTDLSITRAENYGIYNPQLEPDWNDSNTDPDGKQSPKNTVWNKDGWGDLTNLDQRTYTSFYTCVGGSLGSNVLTPDFIMKDSVNNKYYKFKFTVWGNAGAGAPVTYTRQRVDPTTGSDIGSPVTFDKPGYADPFFFYDDIDTGLRISRGSNQGIFNTLLETGWNNNTFGDGQKSPKGTKWNIEGWNDLSNVKTRTYKNFIDAFNGALGEKIVGVECIMQDTINDKYYAIKFTSWTGNGMGGGFSYTRQLINADRMFVHTTGGSEVDDIAPGVGITRGSGGAIYNPYEESGWDEDVSPVGTLWNFDGNHDLSDVESRVYTPFFQAISYWGIGNKIDGSEAVMKVISTGEYYTIKFMSWQQGGGGAFSYVRTAIDLNKINQGIRFADGTLQTTAFDKVVKFEGPIKRSIQEWYGYKSIDLTQGVENTLDTTVKYNVNNSSYIYIVVDSEDVAQDFSNSFFSNVSISLDNGYTWYAVKSSGYGNDGSGWYTSWNYKLEGNVFTANQGDSIKVKCWVDAKPQVWFDPDQSPGGSGNFRGAVIEYHAFSTDIGTIIGQIVVSKDSGEFNVMHNESSSGSYQASRLSLWYSEYTNNDLIKEGQLAAWRTDGESDTIKIQWKATMFYGLEFLD